MALRTPRAALAAALAASLAGCTPEPSAPQKPGADVNRPAAPAPAQPVRPDAGKPAADPPRPAGPKPAAPQPPPKAKAPEEPGGPVPNADPKPPAPGPAGLVRIDSFLGISPDFKTYAESDANGFKMVDMETGKALPGPIWDRAWSFPLSVAFSDDLVAAVAWDNDSVNAVKVISRKSGELEQNIHCKEVSGAAFTPVGRFLAITEFRSGQGFHLVLRDIRGKKNVADVPLGSNGTCSLVAAATRFAAYESNSDRITVVQADTGAVVKEIRAGSFRKKNESFGYRMPLAISPSGKLLACGAEDAVLLYDIDGGKVAQTLEGHLDSVGAVAFSADGETLVSAAKDRTMRLWSVKEGKEVGTVKDFPPNAGGLILSPDGKKVVVLFPVEGGRPKAEIRSVGME